VLELCCWISVDELSSIVGVGFFMTSVAWVVGMLPVITALPTVCMPLLTVSLDG